MSGLVRGLIAALVFVVLGMMVWFIVSFNVDANKVVVVDSWGKFDYIAPAGLHFRNPISQGTTSYRTDIQEIAPEKPVNTYTTDNQEVDVVFKVFYQIPQNQVQHIFEHNRDYKVRLLALVLDRLKVAMGQVNVQTVAEKRGVLRDSILATIKNDAKSYGVEILDFQLPEMTFTDSFRHAVDLAAVAKAGIETREYERQQAVKAAETLVVGAKGIADKQAAEADGNARSTKINADAVAYKVKLEGEAAAHVTEVRGAAEATAIKAQADALAANKNLIELRKAERWSGNFPTHMYGSAPLPFMNVETTPPPAK
jgi:regulator of protease activity HflC (stomatin/prohibitin superfamily)